MSEQKLEATQRRDHAAPDPDHDAKPDSPTDLKGQSWGYVFKRALSEFSKDGCTDLAASLTYFAVLSVFPALLALVSLLGVFGQGEATTTARSASDASLARLRLRLRSGQLASKRPDPK